MNLCFLVKCRLFHLSCAFCVFSFSVVEDLACIAPATELNKKVVTNIIIYLNNEFYKLGSYNFSCTCIHTGFIIRSVLVSKTS